MLYLQKVVEAMCSCDCPSVLRTMLESNVIFGFTLPPLGKAFYQMDLAEVVDDTRRAIRRIGR